MSDAQLVVGLGNPGTRYVRNRHSVGYMVLDALAECTGSRFSQHKKACTRVAEDRLGMISDGTPGPRIILTEPSMLMNPSGGLVTGLVSYYGINPANRLFVIHGELDLPTHELRPECGDDEGSHNDPRFTSKPISTKGYARLRIGIGRPPGRQDSSDLVLSNFPGRERADLGVTLEQVADTVEQVVAISFDGAQQRPHAPR